MTETAIKERPILFSGPLVRQIIAGRKTETRREPKFQPDSDPICVEMFNPVKVDRHGEEYPGDEIFGVYGDNWSLKCPYGQPGDRLWVREKCSFTWDGFPVCNMKPSEIDPMSRVWYAADNDRPTYAETNWTPSIFMPRWASRLTLKVVDVGFERLHEVSQDDCVAEGFEPIPVGKHELTPQDQFRATWIKLNGEPSWNRNPWVWVVKFEKLASEGDSDANSED